MRTRNITADVRVGGKYRWDLTSPEGEEMSAFGEYRELIPGKKIVFTWKWDDDENWDNGPASSQWNFSIGVAEPNCYSSTSNCRARNRAIATMRAGIVFSIDLNNFSASKFSSKQRRKNEHRRSCKKSVELIRKQAWYEALDLYDDNVVSVEAYGMGGGSPETRGKEGVRGKVDWWVNSMEVHSFDAKGPFVAHDRFVVQYDADVSDKKTKERRKMSEVGVYTVKDGKIVREEFLAERGLISRVANVRSISTDTLTIKHRVSGWLRTCRSTLGTEDLCATDPRLDRA